MGRSLSNLVDGEFDALVVTDRMTAKDVEAQGDFAHTGDNPAEFQALDIGTAENPNGTLRIYGNIEQHGGSVIFHKTPDSGSALPDLTFRSTGSDDIVYDGSGDVVVDLPPSPSSLILQQGTTQLGTFDPSSASDTTVHIPKPTLLNIVQGGSTLGTYDPLAQSNTSITIPSFPTLQNLKIFQGSTLKGTYTPTAATAQSITVDAPVPQTYPQCATLTNSATQTFTIPEPDGYYNQSNLIYSGFGLTLGPSPTGSYLFEISFFVDSHPTISETLTAELTQSKTNSDSTYATGIVYLGKGNEKMTVMWRTVVAHSSGTRNYGLGFMVEDDSDGDQIDILFGGTYPDVVMSARPVTNTATTGTISSGGGGGK